MMTKYKSISSCFAFILLFAILFVPGVLVGQNNTEEQASTITGIVKSAATGEPIMAAQIRSLKSFSSATTNQNGEFSIKIVKSSDVLIVNAFDFITREVTVHSKDSQIEITLYSDAFNGNYNEINTATKKVKQSNSPFASNEFKVNNTEYISVDYLLQELSGGNLRSIGRSGTGGQGANMFMRGLNSLNVNAQPLFVVDGVVWNNHYDFTSLNDGFFNNTLVDIDLNDIESISVLKDGTSIYGSKAGNGVIMIKTKRATEVTTKINVTMHSGVSEIPVTVPVLNRDQYKVYLTELLGTTSLKASEINEFEFLQEDPELSYYNTYHNNTDWKEQVYQAGLVNNLNVSASGGDEKALYYFSVGYYGTESVVKNSGQNRLKTRFNSDLFLSDYFTMGLSVGFSNIERTLTDDGVNPITSPTYLALLKSPFLSPYTFTNTGIITTDLADSDDFLIGNPVAIIANSLNTNKHNRLHVGIVPKYQLTRNINLQSQFEYNIGKVKETFYRPVIGAADVYIEGFGVSENVFRGLQTRNISFQNDSRINYKLKHDNHSLNVIYGWRYLNDYFEADYAEGHNSGSDQSRNLLTEEDYKSTFGINNHIKSISNYINVDYNFDYRYFVNLSMALDASSRFGNETQGGINIFGHNWGFFPALNTAWVMSSEDFMQNISAIDNLKLRASASFTGNDDVMPYANSTYFRSTRYMAYANGLVYGNIGNTELQWEQNLKLNVGLDANIFNDRLELHFDLYSNKTSNLLYLEELPEFAGEGYYWNNDGSMMNNGFEANANVKIVAAKDFSWQLGLSVGKYKNKIIDLPQGERITSVFGGKVLTAENNPAGVFYGHKSLGVFSTTSEAVDANLVNINRGFSIPFEAGDIHFEEVLEDGIIDDNDLQVIGDPNPDFYGSFSNRFAYKNISLDAFFTFSYGNDIYNYLRSQLEAGDRLYNQSTAMLGRWSYEGQEASQPRVNYLDLRGNARFSDRWIEDGSYLKLKRLTLNYNIEVNGSRIKGLNISLSAHNLFTITNYLGVDPEVSAGNSVLFQGIDTGLVPPLKTYMVGIKLNL